MVDDTDRKKDEEAARNGSTTDDPWANFILDNKMGPLADEMVLTIQHFMLDGCTPLSPIMSIAESRYIGEVEATVEAILESVESFTCYEDILSKLESEMLSWLPHDLERWSFFEYSDELAEQLFQAWFSWLDRINLSNGRQMISERGE